MLDRIFPICFPGSGFMDDVTVIDVTRAGPGADLSACEPGELPPAAVRLYWEILGDSAQEHPEFFQ